MDTHSRAGPSRHSQSHLILVQIFVYSQTALIPLLFSVQAYSQKDACLEDPRHPSYPDVFPQSSCMAWPKPEVQIKPNSWVSPTASFRGDGTEPSSGWESPPLINCPLCQTEILISLLQQTKHTPIQRKNYQMKGQELSNCGNKLQSSEFSKRWLPFCSLMTLTPLWWDTMPLESTRIYWN